MAWPDYSTIASWNTRTDTIPTRIAELEGLIQRYIKHVDDEEGSDFIHPSVFSDTPFSKSDIDELERLRALKTPEGKRNGT